MKLNWFSPLPPATSGVADYVWQVLPELSRLAEVTVWAQQPSWDEGLEDLARVRLIKAGSFWPEVNRGVLSIFHLGNNPDFHADIWERSRQHPGLVVLHDRSLQHLFASLFLDIRRDHPAYVAAMERCHGRPARQAAEALSRGICDYTSEVMLRLSVQFPMTRLAVEGCLGAIVHSRVAYEALSEPLRCPVQWSALPLAPGEPPPPRKRSPDQPCRLIVLGHDGPNRRLSQIIEVLARMEQREQFRLEIYGHLWNLPLFQNAVERLGIAHLVAFRGFVARQELDDALASSDLAINLRYPTMGEASSSQLAIWRAALPSIVTAVDWYADIPGGIVAVVRSEHEQDDLERHLSRLLKEPDEFVHMGERAREYLLAEHSPKAYAEQLLNLAARSLDFRATGEAFRMARLAAASQRAWTTESVRAHLNARVAEEVLTLFGNQTETE